MNPCLKFLLLLFIIISCISALNTPVFAQDNDSEGMEVYLDFRHRGVINSVVIAYYRNNQFFLPVNELFSLLQIDHQTKGFTIKGNFSVDQTPYSIDLKNNQLIFGKKIYEITPNDYLIEELDFYLRPSFFNDLFGLDFMIDFNNLTLNLQTAKELPVIQKALREQRRKIADLNRNSENYDLKYGREQPFLDGGFLDYNLSASLNHNQNIYNFNTNVGIQLYGGDLQGSIFGSYSDDYSTLNTNNLRWRKMFRSQSWLTKLTVGQTQTDGIMRNSYSGVRITNTPVEPRRLFDEFEVQGTTIPQSEVELYLNNQLIDFQQSGELGNYRFLIPITYGASQLDLKVYGPTGQIIERSNRIQIPFTFQPVRTFNYTINAGLLDNPLIGSTKQNFTLQGNGAYGVTKWLTARLGAEYYDDYNENLPAITSILSARISSNYIFTFEAASKAYYRTILNAIYPNSASLNLDFTDYTSGFGIYNPTNDNKRIVASAFYPFNIFTIPLNLRFSTFTRIRESNTSTTFRFDTNTRFGKLNLRLGYSDRYLGAIDPLNPSNTAYIESSVTYTISRNRNLPEYLRGAFLRAQMKYLPDTKVIDTGQFSVSQNIFHKGRIQLSAGRNFVGGFNAIRFSFIIDFDKIRSSTTFNSIRSTANFTQNVRGSIGYDSNYNNFLLTSRDQVGRSGSAIKLFIDNNGDGSFNQGDDTISENAIRINRSGASTISKDGVLYFTQMQPYYYYNMEMNKGAIKNPMLVPEFDKFGVITDPNRFKKIEIPFYTSGLIEGMVERLYANDQKKGVGGLKLILKQEDGEYTQEIRTFSDGGFYAFEIPPGSYNLTIDPAQLDILKSNAVPSEINFEVEAIPEGDYIEKLNFRLEARKDTINHSQQNLKINHDQNTPHTSSNNGAFGASTLEFESSKRRRSPLTIGCDLVMCSLLAEENTFTLQNHAFYHKFHPLHKQGF